MKKLLLISAAIAALSQAAYAQANEYAIVGSPGTYQYIYGRTQGLTQWSVTGNPTDVLSWSFVLSNPYFIMTQKIGTLGTLRLGVVDRRDAFLKLVTITKIEKLANDQIRVWVRVQRTPDELFNGGGVKLQTASGATIDFDPVLPDPTQVY